MKYNVADDLKFISKCFSLSFDKLSKAMDVPKENLSRIINGQLEPSTELLEKIYGFIYDQNLNFNDVKIQSYKRNHDVILVHGSKEELIGDISLDHSREHVDFGVGFYAGDNYQQALDFVCQTKKGSVYVLDVDYSDLNILNLEVSLDWMLLIALNRGKLEEYSNSSKYRELTDLISKYDVIIAPIADNRMFTTIDDFVSSAISSEQAIHAIKDLSLGKQIVFKTMKAIKRINVLERLYVSKSEKEAAKILKIQKINDADDFISNAYKKYVRQGKYIEEIFSDEND